MSKQKSLAFFGFTKKVEHRGQMVNVDLPNESPLDAWKIPCNYCEKKFKTNQGLSIHLKCVHPSEKYEVAPKRRKVENVDSLEEQLREKEVNELMNGMVQKVVRSVNSTAGKPSINAGKKRKQYPAKFKAEVIHEAEDPTNTLRTVALAYKLDVPMVSRWLKDKTKIIEDAVSSHRKLFSKGRRAKKYVALHAELFKRFKDARKKGQRVDFHWLWSRARVIQKEFTGEESKLGKHVVVQFIKTYNVKMLTKQRNKKRPSESFREPMQKWHATTRERMLRTGLNENYDPKWGRFTPRQRLNVDQSPMPFAIVVKRTYDHYEKRVKVLNIRLGLAPLDPG